MKCIICDKNEAVDHGQCAECLSKNIQISVTGSMDVTVCPKCKSFKIGERWRSTGMNTLLAKKIAGHIHSRDRSFEISIVSDSIELSRPDGKIDFMVTVDGGSFVSEPRSLSIQSNIIFNSCPTCNKLTGSYYEAIIQIRTLEGEYSGIVEKVMDRIDPFLVSMEDVANSFVSKIVRLPEGIDVYLGKKNDALKISRFIHESFFSELKVTKKLAGRRDGEDFYRYTYLVRIMSLKLGTVIRHEGLHLILESVNDNSVTVIDTRDDSRREIRQNEFYSGGYTY